MAKLAGLRRIWPTSVVETPPMRPVILRTLVVCLAIAVAPWLTGGQEPLGMLISGFALLLGSLLVWRQDEARVLKRGPLVWVYGLLIGFAILSLLWTANRYSSVMWVVQWAMAGLAFRLAYAVSAEAVGRRYLVNAYLISAGIFSAVGIWMYLTSEYGRLTGTFYWANPAAAYLIPAILISLDRARRVGGRLAYAWTAAAAGFGMTFLLTDSRAASAVLFVIVMLFLLLVKLNRRFWILFLFSLILAFGGSYGLARIGSVTVAHSAKVVPGSRLNEAIQGESTSGSDRVYYLRSAFNMWFAHPLGGVGAGAYGDAHPSYQLRVVSASTNAHDVYAQTLAELGLVGAMLLAATILVLLFGALRGLLGSPELLPVALGLVGILMHFGLDIDARYPALLLLVGAFFGLLYVQRPTKWVKLGWRWPVLAAAVIVPVAALYFSDTWATRGASAQSDTDYELAASNYARASSYWVGNPDTIGAEGINYYVLAGGGGPSAKSDSDKALTLAHQAEKADPYDAQHHQLEGRVLSQQGNYAGAEKALRRALELDKYNHPDYALDLATLLVSQGQTTEGLSVANSMLAEYPPAVVSNRAADTSVAPNLANLEALIGNVYLKQGDLATAGVAAKKALALDKDNLRGRALAHQVEVQSAPAPTPTPELTPAPAQ